MVQTRNFIVTNYHMNTKEVFEKHKDQIRFIAYGDEICPTTQRPHHQVYLHMFNKKATGKRSLNVIGQLFGGAYVAPMRGSFAQNEAYCGKENTLIKLGEEPEQGKRGDLKETIRAIINLEMHMDDLLEEDPHFLHLYERTLKRAQTKADKKIKRNFKCQGLWIWGKTGVGKTYKVYNEIIGDKDYYDKCLRDEWWDGYEGEEIIVLNEFRGELPFSDLLKLCDEFPMKLKRRNESPRPCMAKQVIITSCKPPEECYSNIYNGLEGNERFEQLRRRYKVRQLVQFGGKRKWEDEE